MDVKASLKCSAKSGEGVMQVFEEAARLSLNENKHSVRWSFGL